jgi:Uma2 family endonuclease
MGLGEQALGGAIFASMVLPIGSKLAPDEFLAWERLQPERHIYVRGQVFAMAGGSPRHNALCARVIARLVAGVEGGPCRVFSADQKIGLPHDEFVYADAVVVCGPMTFRPGTTDVATNPTAVVEVLSKSTEPYDRGDKQKGYLALPSLQDLVLIAQREPRVEIYTRQGDGSFRFQVWEQGNASLAGIGVLLSIEDLYVGAFELPGD